MLHFNFLVIALSALIPSLVGFLWYNPSVFGKQWLQESGLTEDQAKGANMPLVMGLSYVASFLLAIMLSGIVIHQFGVQSTLMGEADFEATMTDFMAKHGSNFRTFKHGMLHGVIAGLFFVLPILLTGALFERKSFKYVSINVGYWIITLALMGGVLCQFT